jgi:hypothetical protein
MPKQADLKARFSAAEMARNIEGAYMATLERIG